MAGIFHDPLELVVVDQDNRPVGSIGAVILDRRYDPLHLRDQLMIRLLNGHDLATASMTITAQQDDINRLSAEVATLDRTVRDLLDIIERDGQNLVDTARQIRGDR